MYEFNFVKDQIDYDALLSSPEQVAKLHKKRKTEENEENSSHFEQSAESTHFFRSMKLRLKIERKAFIFYSTLAISYFNVG